MSQRLSERSCIDGVLYMDIKHNTSTVNSGTGVFNVVRSPFEVNFIGDVNGRQNSSSVFL